MVLEEWKNMFLSEDISLVKWIVSPTRRSSESNFSTIYGGKNMCESAAYILKEDGMERIMDNVVSVDPFEGKVYLTDLLGEQKIVDGEIKEIRLMDHKIIIKENK